MPSGRIGSDASFAALGDLLDGVLDRALPGLPPPQRRALEAALLLADPVGSPPEPRAVAVAFLAVIRHLSASGPVVLAVDDLQWLDDPSARVLEFGLLRLLARQAILLARRSCSPGDPARRAGFDLGDGWRQPVRNTLLRLIRGGRAIKAGARITHWTPPNNARPWPARLPGLAPNEQFCPADPDARRLNAEAPIRSLQR